MKFFVVEIIFFVISYSLGHVINNTRRDNKWWIWQATFLLWGTFFWFFVVYSMYCLNSKVMPLCEKPEISQLKNKG